MKFFPLTLAVLAGCSSWQPRDQAVFSMAVGCHAVDYWQTEWALENGYEEANPMLPSDPSDETLLAYKATAIGLTWWAADEAGNSRTLALAVMMAPCIYAIGSNYSTGARP